MSTAPPLPVDELRQTYLFSALDPEELEQVAATAQRHTLEKGDRLFDQGEPATRFYLVRGGQVKLYRLSAEGQEKIIDIIGPGRSFAEAVMFMEARAYPVYAEAVEPSEVVSFDNEAFRKVLRRSVDTCFRLMGSMSQHLHARVTEIENLCLHNATFRLVSYLLQELPEQSGEAEQARLRLTVPKGVLAARLSIKPETFSRILASLREQGLIEVKGQDIAIRDRKALAEVLVCE